jgi:hypothetical protein
LKTKNLLLIFLSAVILLNLLIAYQIRIKAKEVQQMKYDYSTYNSILLGLFSVDQWKEKAGIILIKQIDGFSLNKQNQEILLEEVTVLLHRLLDELELKVEEQTSQKGIKTRIKRAIINACFDAEEFRKRIPSLAEALVDEMNKEENRDKLKILVKSKVQQYIAGIEQTSDKSEMLAIQQTYGCDSKETCSAELLQRIETGTYDVKKKTLIMLLSTLVIFVLWYFIRKVPELQSTYLSMTIAACIVILSIGITSPMLDIDARISSFSLTLLGDNVDFRDQIIYFQSKSILDVVSILITDHKFLNLLVGFLILAFSILLPAAKLIMSLFVLQNPPRFTRSKFMKWFTFHSGKWSMADVFVVAIFMAFVAFQGILDTQLEQVEVSEKNISILSTNNTSLQPGFLAFIGYCFFSLVLSGWVKKFAKNNGAVVE